MARKPVKARGVRKALLAAYIPSCRDVVSTRVGPLKTLGNQVVEKIIAGETVQKVHRMPSKGSKANRAAKTNKPNKTRLRASIAPGTVLILVAGKHRGKRVVFLKQLGSGLLLVTGPFKLNRVPLYRISQSFVIATSTKIDIGGISISEAIDDDVFKTKTSNSKKELIKDSMEVDKPQVNAVLKQEQKNIDSGITAIVKNTPMLSNYLSSLFSLSKDEAPHALKF